MKKILFPHRFAVVPLLFFTMISSATASTGVVQAAKEPIEHKTYVEPPEKDRSSFQESAKINAATEVMQEILRIPEQVIPPALLKNAHGIAIIPGIVKAAFFLGGRYGSGVLLVHTKEGGWSNPVFLKLMGGGFGWQIGIQSTDVILVFKSSKSIDGITKGKFTLGADASIAAGPLGRSVEAATDVQLKAEIYSYSRNRGLFAGVSLEGAALQIDHDANAAFYGKKGIRANDVFTDNVTYSTGVRKLKDFLTEYASEHNVE